MKYLVVATTDELQRAYEYFGDDFAKEYQTIITGVGGVNVVKSLKDLPKESEILNFGFAGSNKIEKGQVCVVVNCHVNTGNVEYRTPAFELDFNHEKAYYVDCYTSGDFVTSTKLTKPVVFDMELAYICALGFDKISSIKIVSDNLNYEEYEESVDEQR